MAVSAKSVPASRAHSLSQARRRSKLIHKRGKYFVRRRKTQSDLVGKDARNRDFFDSGLLQMLSNVQNSSYRSQDSVRSVKRKCKTAKKIKSERAKSRKDSRPKSQRRPYLFSRQTAETLSSSKMTNLPSKTAEANKTDLLQEWLKQNNACLQVQKSKKNVIW